MTSLRYFIRVNDEVLGPHSLEALQQMASVHTFDDSAMIRPESWDNWELLRDLPELRAQLFPAARKFQFKEKAFDTVNLPTNEAPISVESMLKQNIVQARPHEPSVLEATPRPNKRRRDFLVLTIGCFVFCGVIGYYSHESIVRLFCLGLATVFTAGVYWIMYHVMDRY